MTYHSIVSLCVKGQLYTGWITLFQFYNLIYSIRDSDQWLNLLTGMSLMMRFVKVKNSDTKFKWLGLYNQDNDWLKMECIKQDKLTKQSYNYNFHNENKMCPSHRWGVARPHVFPVFLSLSCPAQIWQVPLHQVSTVDSSGHPQARSVNTESSCFLMSIKALLIEWVNSNCDFGRSAFTNIMKEVILEWKWY